MKNWIILFLFVLCSLDVFAQGFDLLNRQENYQSRTSETVKIPIHIKNNSDKAQFYIIRKTQSETGGTQKGYFCLDKTCLESNIEEFSKKVEPGETLNGLYYVLETGLVAGQSYFKFEVFARSNPNDRIEHNVNIVIDERQAKGLVFQSKDIVINEVYPNPVADQAFIDYKIHNDALKAKVVIHNILGKEMGNYELPVFETKIKITADDLAPGVYFYTLYIENNGVLTRKLIVRK